MTVVYSEWVHTQREEQDMSEQQVTYGLIVVGVVLALASLLVDAVGVGTEGFGVGQIIGLILGIVLAGVGVYRGFIRQNPAA
jgi:hypothetical protein